VPATAPQAPVSRSGVRSAASNVDHRTPGGGNDMGGSGDRIRIGRGRLDSANPRIGHLGLARHDVRRHLDRHRSRAARAQLPKGFRDRGGGSFWSIDPCGPLGERTERCELVGQLVQLTETAADGLRRDLPGEAQHRRIAGVRGAERGGRVEYSGPGTTA